MGGVPGRRTTTSARTCRRSTRRCSSATARTAGSARGPGWWPGAIPFSPALLILWAPGGFRLTCYYYRGAYYKAFWADPPSCTVGEPRKSYRGEHSFPLILQNVHRYFLYLALVFIVILVLGRVEGAVVRRSGHRRGRRSASGSARSCSLVNVVLLGGYTFGCHSLRHLVGGRLRRAVAPSASGSNAYDCVSCLNRRHMRWAWVSLFSVGVRRPLRPAVLDGRLVGLEAALSYETHEHDVLVIGAGGAGLRAAIEASAAGVRVGLVCKSLLGKAHTVMAEGGIAAALANVDERDNWKVHFADTMRGGQYLNNWRMAELHAKEAPDRVRELEAWGALFDRTTDGRILQRNFGGHKYPRLAHVGDRTGLEMIRTLQDHGIHQASTSTWKCTVLTLLKDGDRVVGAFAYDRERGRFRLFQAKAPSCWRRAASGARTASRATAGNTPATGTRWPTTPAPS